MSTDQPPSHRGLSPTLVGVLIALVAFGGLLAWNLLASPQSPPPGPPASTPFVETRDAQQASITFSLDPPRAGDSTYRVTLTARDGSALLDATAVELTLQYLEHASGAPILRATPAPDGGYQVSANSIAIPGRWQIGVRVLGGRADGASSSFTTLIGPRYLPPQEPSLIPYRIDTRNFGLRTVTGLELAIAGLVMILAASWFVPRRSQRRVGTALGAGGIMVGGYMAAASLLVPLAPSELFRNPSPGDQLSVTRGRPVFQTNCASCHGTAGRGDGPAAKGLNPPPADLAGGHILSHTDEDLYQWISSGIDGTAMPKFKDTLTAEQRWDAVNFLRSLNMATQ